MARISRWVLVGLVALALICAPVPVKGQGISVTILCDPDFNNTDVVIPEPFPGVYYGTLSGYGFPPEPYRFVEVSAAGLQERSAPAALAQMPQVLNPTLSSDGRYMAFRPLRDSDLVVWEIATDTLATLTLPVEVAENLTWYAAEAHSYAQKLIWIAPDRILLQQLDENHPGLVRPLRQLEIAVEANPVRLRVVADRTMAYPDFPQPAHAREKVLDTFSPKGSYLSVLHYADTLIYGPLYLQIFDTNANDLVFDFPPEFSLHPRSLPYWSPDETLALIPIGRFDAAGGSQIRLSYLELRLGDGAVETNSLLEQAIVDTFGPRTTLDVLPPMWEPAGERIAFRIYRTDQGLRYIVLYAPQTQELTAICDMNEIGRSDLLKTFWSPDGRYVGYWEFGLVLAFDTQTGDVYRLPNEFAYFFVGWVPGPEASAAP